MKTKHILMALCAIVLAVGAAFTPAAIVPTVAAVIGLAAVAFIASRPRFVAMTNTIEELLTVPPGPQITRTAEEAFSSKYLLATEGTDVGEVQVCAANEIPLGPVSIEHSNVSIAADDTVMIDLLCSGKPCMVVASEAITRGEAVYTAAGGKVQDLPGSTATVYHIGYALTAAAADGDLIVILPQGPIKTVIA